MTFPHSSLPIHQYDKNIDENVTNPHHVQQKFCFSGTSITTQSPLHPQTLLSLSKLCALVSGGDGGGGGAGDTTTGSLALEDDSLSLEEELIHYQEQLPESVLSAHFLDPDTMRVLSPTELIHVSVSTASFSTVMKLLVFSWGRLRPKEKEGKLLGVYLLQRMDHKSSKKEERNSKIRTEFKKISRY